eukprot:g909.t1
MTSTWQKLRRRRHNIDEQTLLEKSMTEVSLTTERTEVEVAREETGESRITTVTQESVQLSPVEQKMIRILSWGYRQSQEAGVRRLTSFVLFVLSSWLLGLFIGNVLFFRSQVFWFLKDLQLQEYYQSFSVMGYERLDELLLATDQDLKDAGVLLRSHRLRILAKAQRLTDPAPVMIYIICTFLIILSLIVSTVFLCVMFHDGFRKQVKAAMLWCVLTLWCRIRVYERHWRECAIVNELNEMEDQTAMGNI